jgi:hypothetical protein
MVLGPLVQEVHQVYADWLSQVIRVYADETVGEMEWMVGSIPIGKILRNVRWRQTLYRLKSFLVLKYWSCCLMRLKRF